MLFFVRIIYGILLILVGAAILKYRRNVRSWTGTFSWAENYVGRGSTYTVIILVGIFLIFLGVLYPFGGLNFIFGTASNGPVDVINK